ncbi:FAD-dependent oxidoreductase [Granulicella cerasi]|uniref:FAD-dependent oxidoreductase n=1 Tax=Granulicella cerasi TaxID=741063 RepID=A0ABW1ZAP3_9BACT|nr:FAD-dependent oxidoreductase [Granulicella cerasi]
MSADVLIAGAGPVGLTLAIELARYGLSVRLIDKEDAAETQSRALAVWSRTLEHLARHPGLDQKFTTLGIHATEARFFHGAEPLTQVKLDTIDSPYAYALLLPQNDTERLLAERLQQLGGKIERGSTLTSFRENGNSVTSVLAHEDGTTEELTTRWLVGCDGAHSAVRHGLGVSFDGDELHSNWMLADVKLAGDVPREAIHLHLHEEGILAIFPIPGDRFRVIGGYSGGAEAAPTLEEVQRLLEQRATPGIVASDPEWLSTFKINERKVQNFRRGSVFLAGDAAHVHSPAGGQGMNTGMQDAVNLAWKLALISGGIPEKATEEVLLQSYTAERGPVAHDVLHDAGLLTRMASVENPLLGKARNAALRLAFGFDVAQQSFAEKASQLAIYYPDSPLNGRDDKVKSAPRVGTRAPFHAGDKPVSTGSKPTFTLFAKEDVNSRILVSCFPGLVDPEIRPAFDEDGVHLVRPDGYVAFAGVGACWQDADKYLSQFMVGVG